MLPTGKPLTGMVPQKDALRTAREGFAIERLAHVIWAKVASIRNRTDRWQLNSITAPSSAVID